MSKQYPRRRKPKKHNPNLEDETRLEANFRFESFIGGQKHSGATVPMSIESLFPNGIPGMAFGGFGGGLKRDSDDEYFDDENEDQPPMTPELATLLRQVPPSEHYYVYDVYNYGIRRGKYISLVRMTQDTLRIGAISPMIFGIGQQNEDILNWAVKRELLPSNWEKKSKVKDDLDNRQISMVEIADTFVQCMLRSEPVNLVKICVHIGEWYRYRDMDASHRMEKKYSLEGLRRDLNAMSLLPSVTLIYANHPEKLIWYIAVFVCHQYFFYLADNEYKEHTLVHDIQRALDNKCAVRLREEGNMHFKAKKYKEAIEKYNEALMHAPYNHLIYANRSIAYLKRRELSINRETETLRSKYAYHAMCDAFRCTKLDPLYVKGYDRYAMSLDAMGKREEAMNVLKTGIRVFKNQSVELRLPDVCYAGDVKLLEQRLGKIEPETPAVNSTSKDKSNTNTASKQSSTKDSSTSNGKKTETSEKANQKSKTNTNSTSKTADGSKSKEDKKTKVEGSFGNGGAVTSKKAKAEAGKSEAGKPTVNGVPGELVVNKPEESKAKKAEAAAMEAAKKAEAAAMEAEKRKTAAEEQEKAVERKQATDELQVSLRDGSSALLEEKYRFAISLYDKCFSILQRFKAAELEQSSDDVLVLRYARGVAYISVGPYEDIILGVKEMKLIMDNQPSPTMKAISLYETAIAYAKQHRYTEALIPISQSMQLCRAKKGLRIAYKWPGTDRFIEHTDSNNLKSKLERLLYECEHPPPPDYRCRADTCVSYGHAHNLIYIDDPHFKGFTCVSCTEKCLLYYHKDCWKKARVEVDKGCTTPDCGGFIYRCIQYNEEATREHETVSNKYTLKDHKGPRKRTPPLKLPTISAVKLERKQEKKRLRKVNKAEKKGLASHDGNIEKEEKKDLASQILADSEKKDSSTSAENAGPDFTNSAFVIKQKRKDGESENAAGGAARLAPKNTKRNKSTKQTMSLDEFCGTAATAAGLEDTGSNYSSGSLGIDPDKPFRIPSHLREDIARFESEYQSTSHVKQQIPVVIQGISTVQLEETVSAFYRDLLESKGPMTADCKEMTEFLEYEEAAKELVKYHGGLAAFLASTGMFHLVDNIICVPKDLRKAKEMTDASRTVKHGVSVVPHDFKANLQRASAYKPERKMLSGYDDVQTKQVAVEPRWQSVVEDWNRSDSIDMSSVDEEIAGRERSISMTSDQLEMSSASADVTSQKQPIKVEKLSPGLLDEWKKAQTQNMLNSLTDRTGSSLEGETGRRRSISETRDPFVRQTASADSIHSDRNSGSMNSDFASGQRCSSNGSAHSSHSRIATPPAYVDFTKPPPPAPVMMGSGGDYIHPQLPILRPGNTPSPPIMHSAYNPMQPPAPTVFAQSHYMTPASYMMPVGVGYGVPQPAPIGTPSMMGAPLGQTHMNRANNYNSMTNSWGLGNENYPLGMQQTVTRPKQVCSVDTQTQEKEISDKQCNTEYEYMDDYDKKVEECKKAHERYSDTLDKFTQLKQASSVEIQDLSRQLMEATQYEKTTSAKYEKLLHQSEKESRKWKDEKRSMQDEVNSAKKQRDDTRWKMEEAERKERDLEEKLRATTNKYKQELEAKESEMRQVKANLNAVQNQAMTAELEVIDLREKYSLFKCQEALENTNKSMEQQRAQVERYLQINPGQQLPQIMRKNAELAAARRQKLMSVRDEQMAIYESQREAVRSGAISVCNLPKLSPPSLLEIMASTSLPMPPRPMMNHMGVRMVAPHPQQGPRHPHMHNNAPGYGAVGEEVPTHQESAQTPGQNQQAPEQQQTGPIPIREQASRRNAAEQQLINDIQSMFPNLSGDNVRSYIGKLRQRRQGQGLSGLKLVDLKNQIIDLVLQDNRAPANMMNGSAPGPLMRSMSSGGEECTICHDKLSMKQNKTLHCRHNFHAECIDSWLARQDTCPVCRSRVN